jgi:hypothetical protein
MKSYPRIQYFNQGLFGENIYAFDKLDGSNIRAEWNPKRGWYKFGTRNNMIDERDLQFGEAVTLFLNKYGDSLPKVFRTNKSYKRIESFVVFAEYVGEKSFAGRHIDGDPKDIILFDVDQYKHGFVTPKNFVEDFGHLHIPDVIYQGPYTMDFVQDIRNNKHNLKEGVIVKGVFKTKNQKDEVWMVKVKTSEWLQKVKSLHGDRALLEELNGDKKLLEI